MVIDNRVGDIFHLVTHPSRTPTKINLFIIARPIVLIESAAALENLAPHGHRAPGGVVNFAHLVILAVVLFAFAEMVGHRVGMKNAARMPDCSTVRVEDFASADGHARMVPESLNERSRNAAIHRCVGIEKKNDLAGRGVPAVVVAAGATAIGRVGNENVKVAHCARLLNRRVRRGIVHHDDFEIGIVNRRERFETRADELLAVESQYDDADFG